MRIYYTGFGEVAHDRIDPRRKNERMDAMMIHEDHQAMANLSPQAIHHEWPKYHEVQMRPLFSRLEE